MKKELLFIVFGLFIIQFAYAGLYYENQQRLEFNHLLYISNITTSPEDIAPGSSFNLKFIVTNTGTQFVRDIVTKVIPPTEITTYNDISSIKIARLNPNDSFEVSFDLISKPSTKEGIYNLPIMVDYVNYIGEERQDNETFGIVLSSIPKILVELKSTEVYRGQETGKITLNFINNNLADVKFLTVRLLESEDYEIIGSPLTYIGDLESDYYQAVDFRIKVDSNKDIQIPLLLTYKDSINRDYNVYTNTTLYMRTAKELGIEESKTGLYLFILLVLITASYIYYRRYKKKKLINQLKLRTS